VVISPTNCSTWLSRAPRSAFVATPFASPSTSAATLPSATSASACACTFAASTERARCMELAMAAEARAAMATPTPTRRRVVDDMALVVLTRNTPRVKPFAAAT